MERLITRARLLLQYKSEYTVAAVMASTELESLEDIYLAIKAAKLADKEKQCRTYGMT